MRLVAMKIQCCHVRVRGTERLLECMFDRQRPVEKERVLGVDPTLAHCADEEDFDNPRGFIRQSQT